MFALRIAKKLLGVNKILKIGDSFKSKRAIDFIDEYRTMFSLKYVFKHSLEQPIPATGPVIIIANHPMGAHDSLSLLKFVSLHRQDLKMVASSYLSVVKPLEEVFIYADPFNQDNGKKTKDASQQHINVRALRESLKHLQNGGVLIIYPSNTISHWNWSTRSVRDPAWSKSFIHFAKKSGATIVPCFIHGRNSLWFQIAGVINKRLRTALIVKELLKKTGSEISISVGPYIYYKDLDINTRDDVMFYMSMLYELKNAEMQYVYTT